MPAYVIVEVEVHDAEAYDRYRKLSGPAVAAHGGRFLVRGGHAELLEGEGEPKRVVVLEFDSMDQAHRWYDSSEYREARSAREGAATARFVLVEGVGE